LIAQLRKYFPARFRLRWTDVCRIATVEVSRATLRMRRMTIQLSCPLCQDEVTWEVDESADELVCGGCAARVALAPDPAITYGLLYEPAA
jgi:hypothetical protein